MYNYDEKIVAFLTSKGIEMHYSGFRAMHEMLLNWEWLDTMEERYKKTAERLDRKAPTVRGNILTALKMAGYEGSNKKVMHKLAAEYQQLSKN